MFSFLSTLFTLVTLTHAVFLPRQFNPLAVAPIGAAATTPPPALTIVAVPSPKSVLSAVNVFTPSAPALASAPALGLPSSLPTLPTAAVGAVAATAALPFLPSISQQSALSPVATSQFQLLGQQQQQVFSTLSMLPQAALASVFNGVNVALAAATSSDLPIQSILASVNGNANSIVPTAPVSLESVVTSVLGGVDQGQILSVSIPSVQPVVNSILGVATQAPSLPIVTGPSIPALQPLVSSVLGLVTQVPSLPGITGQPALTSVLGQVSQIGGIPTGLVQSILTQVSGDVNSILPTSCVGLVGYAVQQAGLLSTLISVQNACQTLVATSNSVLGGDDLSALPLSVSAASNALSLDSNQTVMPTLPSQSASMGSQGSVISGGLEGISSQISGTTGHFCQAL